MRETEKRINYYGVIFWFMYFLCYLPFINKGIDVTDTSYYLIHYKNIFVAESNIQEFGMILTNIIGGIIYNLLPNSQLLVLNMLGIFAYCICGVLTWKMLLEYKKNNIIYLGIFASNLLAISFIKTLNYNVLSSLFFHIGIYLLLEGVFEDKKLNLVFSGFLLGINVYVRFPNLLHLAVGVIFVIKGVQEGDWKARFKEAVTWGIGVFMGVVVGLTISMCFLDSRIISNTLKSYFNRVGSSTDVRGISYGIKFMVQCMKSGLKDTVLYLIIPIILFSMMLKCINKKIVLRLGTFFSAICGIVFQLKGVQRQHSLSLIYFIVYIVLFVGILYYLKKDKKFSIICCISLVISIVGVFGSDTYIQVLSFYSYLPICVSCLVIAKREENGTPNTYKLFSNMLIAFLISIALFGGGQMFLTQVYRDEPYKNLTERMSIEFGPYAGMKTSEKHKRAIESTKKVLAEFPGEELLFLGDFNAGCVVSDTVSFFSVPWPDLASFTVEAFKEELEEKTKQGIYPVILLADKDMFSRRDISNKETIIKEYVEKEKYELYYHDEYITVYIKEY